MDADDYAEMRLSCIEQYAIEGLKHDDPHAKQWFLERIADECCKGRDCSIKGLRELGITWTPGKAP